MDEQRLDLTILADIGALLGAAAVAFGLWQLRSPLVWIWLGTVVLAGSVLAVLPPKNKHDDWPAIPAPPSDRTEMER